MVLLVIDNGSYQIRSVFNGRPLRTIQNIAVRVPISAAGASASASGNNGSDGASHANPVVPVATAVAAVGSSATAAAGAVSASSRSVWLVGDEAEALSFAHLLRGRGRRPLGLGGLLVDAPLQARIWRRLLYGREHAALSSETDVDLVVSVQPGTPKECAVLWYTLCFVLFKFKSVTFVAPGWLDYLDAAAPSLLGVAAAQQPAGSEDAATGNNKPKPKAKAKRAAAAKNTAATTMSVPDADPLERFARSSALVLDVGFAGMRCTPVVNHLPRRAGHLRLDIGLAHVAHFLARLISFTQMNLLAAALPDLLMHRGIMERTLAIDERAATAASSSSLRDHLDQWERALVRATTSENDSEMERRAVQESVYFQGTLKRRLRGRNVQDGRGGGPSVPPPPHIATMWYVLPAGEEGADEQQQHDDAASSSDAKQNRGNKKSAASASSARQKQQRAKQAQQSANKFGYVTKAVLEQEPMSVDDVADDDDDDDATTAPAQTENGGAKKQKKKHSSSSDDSEGDAATSDDADSSDDDSDRETNSRFEEEDEEAQILRLDHERFISGELLFQPRAIVGDDRVSGRVAAAFGGANNSVAGLVTSSNATAAVQRAGAEVERARRKLVGGGGAHNFDATTADAMARLVASAGDGDDDTDDDDVAGTGAQGRNERALLMMLAAQSNCGFSAASASAGGGCVSLLAESYQRFAPAIVADAALRRIVAVGGATQIRGFAGRLRNEARAVLGDRVATAIDVLAEPPSLKPAADCLQHFMSSASTDADVPAFLAKCRVQRPTVAPATKPAHEAVVDAVFAAMQCVLVQ